MDQAVPINSNRYVENKYFRMWEDDGILLCRFADNLEMDAEIAAICVKARVEYSKGKSYPL